MLGLSAWAYLTTFICALTSMPAQPGEAADLVLLQAEGADLLDAREVFGEAGR